MAPENLPVYEGRFDRLSWRIPGAGVKEGRTEIEYKIGMEDERRQAADRE